LHLLLRGLRVGAPQEELDCGACDRHPIAARDIVDVLQGREWKERGALREGLLDLLHDPLAELQRPGMPKVCVPWLVGDCFNAAAGRFCDAGRHPALRVDPLSHPLVHGGHRAPAAAAAPEEPAAAAAAAAAAMEPEARDVWEEASPLGREPSAMRVRLVTSAEVAAGTARPGQVRGARVEGYSQAGLLLGEERDLWQKPCVAGGTCRRRDCRYFHQPRAAAAGGAEAARAAGAGGRGARAGGGCAVGGAGGAAQANKARAELAVARGTAPGAAGGGGHA
jgi:hypothetical protein